MIKISVLLLAGGLGSRLYPLTFIMPKILIKYKNKILLNYHLESLKNIKIKKIYLNLLNRYFYKFFKNKIPKSIRIIKEKNVSGSGGALAKLIKLDQSKTDLLVIFSDTLFLKEQNKIIKNILRNRNQNKISISVSKIKKLYDKKDKGLIKIQGNKIISFNEKPRYISEYTNYFFSGLVLIPYQLKKKVFNELNCEKNKIADFSDKILSSKKFKINVIKTKIVPKDFGDWSNLINNLITKC